MSEFVERLDYLIFEHELNAKALGKEVGICGSSITRYLKEHRLPTVNNLVLIANYFNCSINYLMGLDNEIYPLIFKPCPPFSERIKKILADYQKPLLQFSRDTKIHPSRIYDWINGKRQPTIENVIKIANLLNCSIDAVLGRE